MSETNTPAASSEAPDRAPLVLVSLGRCKMNEMLPRSGRYGVSVLSHAQQHFAAHFAAQQIIVDAGRAMGRMVGYLVGTLDSVFEGITATKGFVDYNADASLLRGVSSPATMRGTKAR